MAQQRLPRWGSQKRHPFPEALDHTLAGEDPAPGLGRLGDCPEILTQLALLSPVSMSADPAPATDYVAQLVLGRGGRGTATWGQP